MPEGPTVKRFQLRCSSFVGQAVTKVGGSTKQMNPDDLKGLVLQDTKVHGKNLFLAFGGVQEAAARSESSSTEPSEPGSSSQGIGLGRGSAILQSWEGGKADSGGPWGPLQEEHEADLPSFMDDAAGPPWKWLRFHFWLYGSIRANEFARANKANKRGDWKDPVPRLVLHFDGGGFLVFYNCRIHSCSSPTAEPATDILSLEFDQEHALGALCKAVPVCHTLLDQRYFSGLGNIIKNEALYLAKINPLSLGSLLPLPELRSLLDHAVRFTSEWFLKKQQRGRQHWKIYQKETCPEGHQVRKEAFGPPDGLKRLTWWCPQCQPQVAQEEVEDLSTRGS
nr:endonuclease 8-like 2 [Zootoca vivipara]